MAGVVRIELTSMVLETIVLPLNYTPMVKVKFSLDYVTLKVVKGCQDLYLSQGFDLSCKTSRIHMY